MSFAYGWAFARPVRKIYYNITVTALSVAVALRDRQRSSCSSVLADRLSLSGGIWDFVSNLDLNLIGYGIVALFVVTWAIALAIWHFGKIEQRWTTHLERP